MLTLLNKNQCARKLANLFSLTVAIIGMGFSSFATANLYAGILANQTKLEYSITTDKLVDSSPWVMQVQGGYFFNNYLAAEVRYGTSISRNKDIAVDSNTNALIKVNVPITDRIAIYGLAGVGYADANHKYEGSHTNNGFSFGTGLHYALSRKNAVVLEFLNHVGGQPVSLSAIIFGLQHKF